MAATINVFLTCLLFLVIPSEVHPLPKDQFYPFGAKLGDAQLPKATEDVSSSEIRLKTPVKFFSREYSGIYVSCMITIWQL
jgi:hypothetical protein